MAKIPVFTADINPKQEIFGGRRAVSEDAGGDGLGMLGRTIQGVNEKIQDTREAEAERQVLVWNAQTRQRYAEEYARAETTGEPLDKIRARLEDDVAKIQMDVSTTRGQTAAEIHAANTLAYFGEREKQISVERAVGKARNDMTSFMGTNTDILMRDPSYLSLAERDADAMIGGYANQVKPHQLDAMRLEVKNGLHYVSASAMAKMQPETTIKNIEAGAYKLLSPEQRLAVVAKAEREIDARETRARQKKHDMEWDKQQASKLARDDYVKQMYDGKKDMSDIAYRAKTDDRLATLDREHILAFIHGENERKTGRQKPSDPASLQDLWLDINAPEGDSRKMFEPGKIYQFVKEGRINTTDATRFIAELASAKDPSNSSVNRKFYESMQLMSKALADQINGYPAPVQAYIVAQWAADTRHKMDNDRKDRVDPTRLFNPNDKDSVVNMASFKYYDNMAKAKVAEYYKGLKDKTEQNPEPATPPAPMRRTVPVAPGAHPVYKGVVVPPAKNPDESLFDRIARQYPRRTGEQEDKYSSRISNLLDQATEGGAK